MELNQTEKYKIRELKRGIRFFNSLANDPLRMRWKSAYRILFKRQIHQRLFGLETVVMFSLAVIAFWIVYR